MGERLKSWKPVDWVVVILTLAISSGVIIAVSSPIIRGEELSPEAVKAVASGAGACISIISMYVGASIQARTNK